MPAILFKKKAASSPGLCFQMRSYAFLQLKELQNCERSKMKVQRYACLVAKEPDY